MPNSHTINHIQHSNARASFPSLILFKYLFLRSFRKKSYQLFCLILIISSLLMSLMGFYTTGVQSALNEDISKFLGAPLVIASDQPLEDNWWHENSELNQVKATVTASYTYGVVGKSGYHSIALKAVSADYPKKDQLKLRVKSQNKTQEILATAEHLKPFDAWLDERAMVELGLQLGDSFQIGKENFNVAGIISLEPDRLTQLQHLLPRVMIRMDELSSVGLDLYNSRGEYRYLFDESPEILKSIEDALPSLIHSPYQMLKANSGGHPFARMAKRSENLLSLVMVLIMLMCGSAAALTAGYSMKRFIMPATILRCLGVNKNSLTKTMILMFSILAILSTIIGTAMGWFLQPLIKELLQPHLIINQTVFNFRIPLITFMTNALIIIAFILPRLKAIGSVVIVSVLRGQLMIKKNQWLMALTSIFAVVLILWYFSDNSTLTLILSSGVAIIVLLAVVFGWVISQLTMQFHRVSRGTLKIVLRSIGRNPKKNSAPMATIALAVLSFLIINTLRNDFIETFHVESLNQDGNLLFSRLPSDQYTSFSEFTKAHELTLKGIYPTTSAKLESINGVNIKQALTQESETREEIRSPVRLSWAINLPQNNRLLTGEWPMQKSDGVSVEAEVMADLGLKIGDELGFRIKDKLFKTKISSTREFKAGASRMMFWFMVAPDALEEFNHQYMGGIAFDRTNITNNKDKLAQLNAQFPQVMFSDLQQIINMTSDIMTTIMKIMSTILILLLVAAITVLIASVYVGDYKSQQILMRTLGVSKRQLITMNILQQGLIGFVASVVGILAAQMISGVIYDQLFNMPYDADVLQNIIVICVITFSFIITGLLLSYNNLKNPLFISHMKQTT